MHRTYQQARSAENKPICRGCHVPCDPKSREYRAGQWCPVCYDFQPIILKKKELLCKTLR